MKNVLARGGVEFLAVLFGITISLWVEDSRQNTDIQNKIVEDYKNIQKEIELDIANINRIISSVEGQVVTLEKLILYNRGEIVFDPDSIIDAINFVTSPTFFGTQTAYNASVSSGRLNFSSDMKISNEIALLYEHYYKRLDVNSLIYDKRMHELRADHLFQFSRFISGIDKFDPATKSLFLSMQTRNALYWILGFAKNNYTSRLNETRSQMIKAESTIDQYLTTIK